MRVKHKKLKNVRVKINGKQYQFENGYCEVPKNVADEMKKRGIVERGTVKK